MVRFRFDAQDWNSPEQRAYRDGFFDARANEADKRQDRVKQSNANQTALQQQRCEFVRGLGLTAKDSAKTFLTAYHNTSNGPWPDDVTDKKLSDWWYRNRSSLFHT